MLGIIGAGSWGTALALQAAVNQQPVTLWEYDSQIAAALTNDRQNRRYLPDIPFPDNLLVSSDLEDCVASCSEILVVVPSSAFRSVLQQLKPLLKPEQGLAWASKGLDPDNGELLHQVAQQIFGDDFPLAVLSGPSFALEVAQYRPTAISLASNNEGLASRIVNDLHSDTFRIYTSGDMAGVCLGGAYKNVLAIAAGIADGLSLGHNTRAALITRGLTEMQRLGLTMGGQAETFMGLAGLGDLVLTCTGDLSRNRRLGMALAKGKTLEAIQSDIGQVTEGVETARVIHKLASTYQADLPIAEEVYKVLFEGRSPKEAVSGLLSREPRQEF
ncbi:MAG: NAD(P)-dependent glycerol-3-phosphate dehydrogenase [Gammaproteobacteria bacterium]|nr:NAD(P)-dependent glycerol-3-phosphate dehydrogenase [Gammaproteobacteria bacterium]